MRRLITLTTGLTKSYRKVRITIGARLDLLMWLDFLSHFNGVSAFLIHEWENDETSATNIGLGVCFGGRWT